jgi:hypothetical protein
MDNILLDQRSLLAGAKWGCEPIDLHRHSTDFAAIREQRKLKAVDKEENRHPSAAKAALILRHLWPGSSHPSDEDLSLATPISRALVTKPAPIGFFRSLERSAPPGHDETTLYQRKATPRLSMRELVS